MTEDHSKLYKHTHKVPDEMRRRREEEGVNLRKQKRDEQLNKRRQVDPQAAELFSNHGEMDSEISSELLQYLYSGVPEYQLQATEMLRKHLSKEPNPPIDQIIAAGVVPQFVQFLSHSHNLSLQFEAAWALTNIASGTSLQTQQVVQAGAVDSFIELLGTKSLQVCEQAVWALGNIAGDNPDYRDMVISKGAIPPLCDILISHQTTTSIIRNTVWCISNLCRGKSPPPDFSQVRVTLGFLPALLYNKDVDTLADACWSISYLADGPNSNIQKVIDSGVCRRLVELLAHRESKVVAAALRAVGNIVTGDNRQTQMVINCSALPLLLQLLSHVKETIRKESCWTISNITAGSRSQIQAVLDCNIVPTLVEVMSKAEFKTRKEAAWAITNATSGGNKDQIRYIINQDCIEPLCNLLTVVDPKIISVALNGLENILKLGKMEAETIGHNPYAIMVEECFGLDKLEYLQQHSNMNIYKKAYSLIDAYFGPDSDEDTAVVPDSQETGFAFNNAITEASSRPSYSF